MATNFSLNVRRIRDLVTLTNIGAGSGFSPADSYVLVDAYDDDKKYTTYKMSLECLSSAVSGVVSQETIDGIRSELNTLSTGIKSEVETTLVTNITNAEGFITSISNAVSSAISANVANSVSAALIQNGIATDIATALKTDGIAADVASKLSTDSDVTNSIAVETATTLKSDDSFKSSVVNKFSVQELANLISASTEFVPSVVPSVANELTANADFIAAVKAAIDALEPEPEPEEDPDA